MEIRTGFQNIAIKKQRDVLKYRQKGPDFKWLLNPRAFDLRTDSYDPKSSMYSNGVPLSGNIMVWFSNGLTI
jgi:hypothetical protein